MRARGASGDAAWDMGIADRGTPPKGTDQRTNSATVSAPGNASHRPAPRPGVAAPAAPTMALISAVDANQPGLVKSHIHSVEGSSHATANNAARRKRLAAPRLASS